MELVNHININNLANFLTSFKSHDEFIHFVLEKGIQFTTDESLGLTILRYNREHPNCNFEDSFTRFCRGMILDKERNIVCLPPDKHIPFENLNYESFSELLVEDFIDGTMINLFYYGERWHIATRSKIGANGTWFSRKKFSEMFDEAKGNMEFEHFEKNHTYTFVLRHPENRIVTQYENADLVLVQVRNMNSLMLENTALVKHVLQQRGVEVNIPVTYNFTDLSHLHNYLDQLGWQQQGVMIKLGNMRSKLQNQRFKYVKSMKSNNPRTQYSYLELWKRGGKKMIFEYLSYFPEFKKEFNAHWFQLNNMLKLILRTYLNFAVNKSHPTWRNLSLVQYELKPLIYELHGHYLKGITKEVNSQWIESYFQSLEVGKMIFVLNYQKNLKRQMEQEQQQEILLGNTEMVSPNKPVDSVPLEVELDIKVE